MTREWAFGGATGQGVCVCILDSGIERDHPLVGEVERSVYVRAEGDDVIVEEDEEGDVSGPRNSLREHRPLARAGVLARQRPCPRRRPDRKRPRPSSAASAGPSSRGSRS